MLLPDTSITNNADGHACCETSKSAGQASSKMRESIIQAIRLCTYVKMPSRSFRCKTTTSAFF
jgi:hypothetical protein